MGSERGLWSLAFLLYDEFHSRLGIRKFESYEVCSIHEASRRGGGWVN